MINCSIEFGFKFVHELVTIRVKIENTLSIGALLAGIAGKCLAILERIGNFFWLFSQYSNQLKLYTTFWVDVLVVSVSCPSTASTISGSCKYCSISVKGTLCWGDCTECG